MMDLFMKDFELANLCTHKSQCMPCFWCCLVCCIHLSRLDAFFGVTSALCSVWHQVFCSQIICASSVSNSRMVWTSSACWHSSALKRDKAMRLLAFLVNYASDSSSDVRYFSSLSGKVRAFLHLDVVKLYVCRDPHTGIWTFIIAAVSGQWNL